MAWLTGFGHISPEHARELVARPGTVLHRLVTDPLTGRLIERSVPEYRPDAAMVAQIRAADVTCRAPGCVVPAARCDLDHERPYESGGPTSETNLNAKHRGDHLVKTLGWWRTQMDATRTVSWTTFFGRLYITRAHDYRAYDTERPDRADPVSLLDPATVTDPDLRNRLVYAALSSRDGYDRWLEAFDDVPDHDDQLTPRVPLTVLHRRGATTRRGAPPGAPTITQLLAPPGEARPGERGPGQQDSGDHDSGEPRRDRPVPNEPPPF